MPVPPIRIDWSEIEKRTGVNSELLQKQFDLFCRYCIEKQPVLSAPTLYAATPELDPLLSLILAQIVSINFAQWLKSEAFIRTPHFSLRKSIEFPKMVAYVDPSVLLERLSPGPWQSSAFSRSPNYDAFIDAGHFLCFAPSAVPVQGAHSSGWDELRLVSPRDPWTPLIPPSKHLFIAAVHPHKPADAPARIAYEVPSPLAAIPAIAVLIDRAGEEQKALAREIDDFSDELSHWRNWARSFGTDHGGVQ